MIKNPASMPDLKPCRGIAHHSAGRSHQGHRMSLRAPGDDPNMVRTLTSLQSPHGAEPIGAQHADRNFVSGHRRPEPAADRRVL
jgi:hypothetical protein